MAVHIFFKLIPEKLVRRLWGGSDLQHVVGDVEDLEADDEDGYGTGFHGLPMGLPKRWSGLVACSVRKTAMAMREEPATAKAEGSVVTVLADSGLA